MSLGENIRKYRQARGLTQEALGEKLGMAAQTVSKWEREESMPDAAMLPKLAELLGVSLDRLFDRAAGSFEDAYSALKGWLLSLERKSRWKGALRLGQGMLTVLSGTLDDPATRSWEANWLDGRETELFSLYVHADLMQILLLGNAGPWGTVGFGTKEEETEA